MAKKDKSAKKEKEAKEFIELAFKPHEGEWMETSDRLLEKYKGRYHDRKSARPRFTHNSLFSLINLLLPNFILHQPYIRVKAKAPRFLRPNEEGMESINNLRQAEVIEAVTNNEYKQINGIYQDRLALQDALIFGFGITKTGYSFETTSTEDKDYITKDTAFHRRVNPKDFGWHPLATTTDDSIKLVHRLYMPRSRLEEYEVFDTKALDKVQNELPKHLKDKLAKKGQQDVTDYVTLYEVHDQEKDMIYYYGGEEHIFLGKKERAYHFTGSDFSLMRFSYDPDEFLGLSMMEMIEDEAMALNEVLTLIVEHYRKFAGQVFYQQGSLDEDDIERMRNSEIGSLHGIPDIDKIKFMSPLSMGSEYFNIVNLMITLMDRTLGIPDFKRLTSTTRKSATEASFIQGDATIRRAYFLDQVKQFVLNGIEKVVALKQQFANEKEIVYDTGDLAHRAIQYTKEDIQGEYQFDLDVDNMSALNQTEANNLIQAIQVLGQTGLLQGADPAKTSALVFKKVTNMNIEEILPREPESMVHVDPKRENELARNGDPMPNPKKREDHVAHAKAHIMDLKTNGPNEAILDHLVNTMALAEQEGIDLFTEVPELKAMRQAQMANAPQAPGGPGGPSGAPTPNPNAAPKPPSNPVQAGARSMAPNQRIS